jgi:hypothetical protein
MDFSLRSPRLGGEKTLKTPTSTVKGDDQFSISTKKQAPMMTLVVNFHLLYPGFPATNTYIVHHQVFAR